MNPVTEARMIAINTLSGTIAHQLAITICQIRGINPDYPTAIDLGLTNWQGVIMETFLLGKLAEMTP